jgi:hypothetical protein
MKLQNPPKFAFQKRKKKKKIHKKKKGAQEMDGHLRVVLVRGENLAVRDASGTSDPWVKFRLGSQKLQSTVKLSGDK